MAYTAKDPCPPPPHCIFCTKEKQKFGGVEEEEEELQGVWVKAYSTFVGGGGVGGFGPMWT